MRARAVLQDRAGRPDLPDSSLWSRQVIWGNHRLTGGVLNPDANAWAANIVWGTLARRRRREHRVGHPLRGRLRQHRVGHHHRRSSRTSSGARRWRNIVWGTADDGENIVWGTAGSRTSSGARLRMRRLGEHRLGHAAMDDCENIVWGTASDGRQHRVGCQLRLA